jgi:hypothetical protein
VSAGGGGAPAERGDATWIHTSSAQGFWTSNGGQFDGEPSTRLVVTGPGSYRFESPELIRDLAFWAANPERNFGWILIGDETVRQTARGSRVARTPTRASAGSRDHVQAQPNAELRTTVSRRGDSASEAPLVRPLLRRSQGCATTVPRARPRTAFQRARYVSARLSAMQAG